MGNTVTPKLSGAVPSFKIKTYNYGGSTTSSEGSSIFDYAKVDYSYTPEKKSKITAKDVGNWLYKAYSATGAFVLSTVVSSSYGILMLHGTVIATQCKVASWATGLLGRTKLGKKLGLDKASKRLEKASNKTKEITQKVNHPEPTPISYQRQSPEP